MERKQRISIYLAAGCLLLGSALYVLFRPTTLLMFLWADVLGFTKLIVTIRTWVIGLDRYLPSWIIYSLPFALWVLSYLFIIKGIWGNSSILVHYAWFCCVPLIAIAAELAQKISIIPGNFDFLDLIAIMVGTIIGFFAIDL